MTDKTTTLTVIDGGQKQLEGESDTLRNATKALTSTLMSRANDFARALSNRIPPELFIQIVANAYLHQPELTRCSQLSIYAAAMELARLGLRPDGEEAALVAYRNKDGQMDAEALVMYQGYTRLMRRAGCRRVEAQVVYSHDVFRYTLGLTPTLEHVPPQDLTNGRGDIIGAYAVVKLDNGEIQFEVMDRGELAKVRGSSKAPNSPAWREWESEMARIRPLRRLRKWVDLDPIAAAAFRKADAWDAGEPAPLGKFAPELDDRSLDQRVTEVAAARVEKLHQQVTTAVAETGGALDRRIGFGKHKDMTWQQLLDSPDRGYVTHWLLKQSGDKLTRMGVTSKLFEALSEAAKQVGDAQAGATTATTSAPGSEAAPAAPSQADGPPRDAPAVPEVGQAGDSGEESLLVEAHAKVSARLTRLGELGAPEDARITTANDAAAMLQAGDLAGLMALHAELGRKIAEEERR